MTNFFFFQAEDGIRADLVTGVQTCALPIFGLCILPLLSPLAWKAHFVSLLAGYWLIWRAMQGVKVRRGVWLAWWASFACLTLTAPALISTDGRSVVESLNVITLGALLVLGLTIWAARRLPQQPPTSAAGPTQP